MLFWGAVGDACRHWTQKYALTVFRKTGGVLTTTRRV